MAFNFNDPLILQLRSGKSDDPFLSKSESKKIINNIIVLSEIPDEFTKVSVTGYYETKNINPTSNEFTVNYQNGMITFNASEEGKTVQVSYMGRGIIQYPAERIYSHNKNTNASESLQTIINNGQTALDNSNTLNAKVAETNTAIANANTATTNANTARDNAQAKADSLSFKGDWNSAASYKANNLVNYNNTAHMALIDNTNVIPSSDTTKWKVVVDVSTAIANANTATTSANTAADNANAKATLAEQKATLADTATTNANTATTNANNAATSANALVNETIFRGSHVLANAYKRGNSVLSGNTLYICIADAPSNTALTNSAFWNKSIDIQTVVDNAVTATNNANTATTDANTAKTNADTATSNANTATTNANNAASAANTAKTNADIATGNANQATTNANNAASSANNLVTTFVSKGQYDSATAYAPNNTVLYNGSSWRCLKNTTGNVPAEGTTWTLVASKGIDGSGSGTVLSVTSANSDISIINTTTNPVLTLNSGTVANKILKLDSSGKAPVSIITEDSTHRFVTDVEKSTWNGKTGSRATTFVVAASNSTTKGQAGADYVCDGVSDQTEINNAFSALPIIVWESGTTTAGTTSTITLASTRSGYGMNWYVGYTIAITSGTGSGQSKVVIQYDSNTNIVTVDSAWTTIPDTTSVYELRSKFGKVILLEGLFNISSQISVPTNCTLEGQGEGTIIKPADGNATSFHIIQQDGNGNVSSGASHITVKNLKIDGNRSNSTATQNGIHFSKSSYCTVYDCVLYAVRNVAIQTISVGGIGVYANKFINNIVFGSGSAGISTNGHNHIIQGNIISYNASAGISHSTGSGLVFNGNVVTANTVNGISLLATTNSVVSANTVIGTKSGNGIKADSNSDNNTITGNTCNQNEYHGIYILSGSNNTINGNTCTENSQSATTTYDNICLGGGNTNNIQVNTCRQGALTNRPRYGVNVSATACTGNLITNNDLTTGGATGAFADSGTSTITTAGNKVA